ncbi:glutathionylspermidine synthase family protein [Ochrobactrum phage vB_OspM_OC]|nr:glutathionylspermidine synthase family protein [Ochrobactrum phage vB_OspM_OC]
MERISFGERPDWQKKVEEIGFDFHTFDGERYWDERNAYKFSLEEIENNIEDPTTELMEMCYNAVSYVCDFPDEMARLQIPEEFRDAVIDSWNNKDKDLYGRFDLAYDGNGPAKMLEFNADTPTSLFEASVVQWMWLEDMKLSGKISADADQFNSIHEKLKEALPHIVTSGYNTMHLAAFEDSREDWTTIKYLADIAYQIGKDVVMLDVTEIGIDAQNWFTDKDDKRIEHLFKLYPLEDMVREEFGKYLIDTPTTIIEPLWKLVLSNKGILPILWEMYPDHPNLLPSYFEGEQDVKILGGEYVRKPIFSREGANIEIISGQTGLKNDGPYGAEGHIIQAYNPLPRFGNDFPVIGSWVIAGQAAGIGIREDDSLITKNSSRFVPHFID